MDVFVATVDSLIYGGPLYPFAKAASNFIKVGALNKFYTQPLASPNDTSVVRPNSDTIYCFTAFDLSKNELGIQVPDFTKIDGSKRYWSICFFDPFGGEFVVIGSVGENNYGKYLLQHKPQSEPGLRPAETGSGYEGYINSPTAHGILLARLLVKDLTQDYNLALNFISESLVTNPIALEHPSSVPSLTLEILAPYYSSSSEQIKIMQLLANLSVANPPYGVSHASSIKVSTILQVSGIQPGIYTQPAGVDLDLAFKKAKAEMTKQLLTSRFPAGPGEDNHWLRTKPQGTYGDDWVGRSALAEHGYLATTPDEALYPTTAQTLVTLQDTESITYGFSGKPPIGLGFWSLTLYDKDGFLVTNQWNIYKVSSETGVKYPNGTSIYGEGSDGEDHPFEILVQAKQPPQEYMSNWLPSPPETSEGGVSFNVTMRLYAPTKLLQEGKTYVFPTITQGPAIIA